jgi:ribosome-associated protein
MPEEVKARLRPMVGSRLSSDDVIVIFAQEHRSLLMNQQAGRARLVDLFRQAAVRPKHRRATRPTYASKLKRLDGKTRRAGIKAARGRPQADD